MMGGPTMNLLLAIFFFFLLLVGIGIPTPTTTVAEVGKCVPSYMATQEAAAAAVADPTIVRDAPECGPEDRSRPRRSLGSSPVTRSPPSTDSPSRSGPSSRP